MGYLPFYSWGVAATVRRVALGIVLLLFCVALYIFTFAFAFFFFSSKRDFRCTNSAFLEDCNFRWIQNKETKDSSLLDSEITKNNGTQGKTEITRKKR